MSFDSEAVLFLSHVFDSQGGPSRLQRRWHINLVFRQQDIDGVFVFRRSKANGAGSKAEHEGDTRAANLDNLRRVRLALLISFFFSVNRLFRSSAQLADSAVQS